MLRLLMVLACGPGDAPLPEPEVQTPAAEPVWQPPVPLQGGFTFEPPGDTPPLVLVVQHGEGAAVEAVGEVIARVETSLSLLPPEREPLGVDLLVQHRAPELAAEVSAVLERDFPQAQLTLQQAEPLEAPVVVRTAYTPPVHLPVQRNGAHTVLTVWGDRPTLAVRVDSQAVLVTSERHRGVGESYLHAGVWEHIIGSSRAHRLSPAEGHDASWSEGQVWWQLSEDRHVPWYDEVPAFGVFSTTPGEPPVLHPERARPPSAAAFCQQQGAQTIATREQGQLGVTVAGEALALPDTGPLPSLPCVSPDGQRIAWLAAGEHHTTQVHIWDRTWLER